jgi:flagellar P-ring protein FlgI
MKKIFILVLIAISFTATLSAAAVPVRLKDIGHILEARDNQLMGFGLVVGLKNTGDTIQTEFTKIALTNLLSRMGIVPMDREFRSKNVAAVMVTAKLPPFVNNGQKIDVTVSSLGDATTLQGGTLLMTQLEGPDDVVYAVAQGQLEVGYADTDNTFLTERRLSNSGRIANGGIVEKEVPVSIADDYVSIVLDKPDYTTASRVAAAMQEAGISAKARDAATIVASKEASKDMVDFIASIEDLNVVPDTVAKVVINEQNGVIVMGENVTISPIAVSYGDTNVAIGSTTTGSAGGTVEATEPVTLMQLVTVLNSVGVRPKDLIAIIQAIKSSGAISADIEVI